MANVTGPGVARHLCRLLGRDGADGIPDAQLLEQFVTRRDEAAFELLVWRHERLVLGVCRRLLRDAHEAEDAFQATFLALARKAGSIGRRQALAGWLSRVAYRTALRARVAARRRPGPVPPDFDLPAAAGGEPDTAAAWRELRPVLDQEVDRLPDKYRVPVVLCYLEGKTYAEAARQLGWSAGTVSTRLTKARELLRRRLARRGLGLTAGVLAAVLAEQSAAAAAPVALVCRSARTAGAVPARVAALTEGVLRAMLWTKVKVVAAVVLTAGLMVTGAGVFLRPGAQAEPPAAEEPPAAPQAEKEKTPAAPRRPDPEQTPLDRYLAGWEKAFADADTLVATNVSRVENLKTFGLTKTYTGTFKYRRPGRFILEMHEKEKPDKLEKLVCSGRVLYQYVPQEKEIRACDFEWPPPKVPEAVTYESLLFRLFNPPDWFVSLWCGHASEAKQRWDLKFLKVDDYYVYIDITPRTKKDKADFRTARLVLNKDSLMPRQLWFEQPNGDTITWDVPRLERNVPLSEKEFVNPPVPRGWRVVWPDAREGKPKEQPRRDPAPPPDPPPQ
jgi:TIGR03009 family protein